MFESAELGFTFSATHQVLFKSLRGVFVDFAIEKRNQILSTFTNWGIG